MLYIFAVAIITFANYHFNIYHQESFVPQRDQIFNFYEVDKMAPNSNYLSIFLTPIFLS